MLSSSVAKLSDDEVTVVGVGRKSDVDSPDDALDVTIHFGWSSSLMISQISYQQKKNKGAVMSEKKICEGNIHAATPLLQSQR